MFSQFTQLTAKIPPAIIQLMDALFNFISNHSVLAYSFLLGLSSLLFFNAIIRLNILPGLRKNYFLKIYSSSKQSQPYLKEVQEIKNATLHKLKFLSWKKIPTLSNFYKTFLWANLPFTYEFFLTIGLSLFVVIFFLIITFASFFTSLITASLLLYFYFFTIKVLAKRNYKRISTQLPFILETLSSSIQSGYSLPQALQFTAKETPLPFRLFFDDMLAQINYNIPLNKVFANIQTTTSNQEFKIVLDGLIMQGKMGGDIVKMLQQMATWVRQKNKLKKDIKVFTSQGRLSGIIIMLLWPISALIFYFLNPDYITILFSSGDGKIFLMLSLILEFIGFAMIWKIIKIKI